MKNRTRLHGRPGLQGGSAFSETILGLMVLVPAFWAVDHLGRLADIQRDASMGARYAVWQSLATPPDQTVPSTLLPEVRDRVHGHVHAPLLSMETIGQVGYSRHVLREGGRTALAADTETNGVQTRQSTADGTNRLSREGPGAGLLARGRFVPAGVGLGGLSSNMLGLPDTPLTVHEQRVELTPQAIFQPAGGDLPAPAIKSSAALLSESWVARSDNEYQRRTHRIVASQPVDIFTRPARFIGRFPVFREGRHAAGTDFVPPSAIH